MQILQEENLKNDAMNELSFQHEFAGKIIKIGSPADYPPFAYIDNNNEYAGLDVDVVSDIFNRLKVNFTFVKTSWASLHTDLLAGKFDMAIGGISLTIERKEFLYSESFMQSGKTLLTLKKYEHSIKSMADVDRDGITVVVNCGGTNEQFVKSYIKNAKVVVVENNCEIFSRLAAGEFNFMFTDLTEAFYRQSLDDRLVVAKPIRLYTQPLPYGFIYNQQQVALRNCIDIYLRKFAQSQRINDIKQKYFKLKSTRYE